MVTKLGLLLRLGRSYSSWSEWGLFAWLELINSPIFEKCDPERDAEVFAMRGYVPKKINYYSLPNKTDIFDRFEVKTIKNNKKDIIKIMTDS
jgi:hypothetical protein